MIVLVVKPYKPDPYHDNFDFVQKRVFNKNIDEMVLKQKYIGQLHNYTNFVNSIRVEERDIEFQLN